MEKRRTNQQSDIARRVRVVCGPIAECSSDNPYNQFQISEPLPESVMSLRWEEQECDKTKMRPIVDALAACRRSRREQTLSRDLWPDGKELLTIQRSPQLLHLHPARIRRDSSIPSIPRSYSRQEDANSSRSCDARIACVDPRVWKLSKFLTHGRDMWGLLDLSTRRHDWWKT